MRTKVGRMTNKITMNEQEKARLAELQKTDEAEIYPHLDAILSELDDVERKYIEDSKIDKDGNEHFD